MTQGLPEGEKACGSAEHLAPGKGNEKEGKEPPYGKPVRGEAAYLAGGRTYVYFFVKSFQKKKGQKRKACSSSPSKQFRV